MVSMDEPILILRWHSTEVVFELRNKLSLVWFSALPILFERHCFISGAYQSNQSKSEMKWLWVCWTRLRLWLALILKITMSSQPLNSMNLMKRATEKTFSLKNQSLNFSDESLFWKKKFLRSFWRWKQSFSFTIEMKFNLVLQRVVSWHFTVIHLW